VIEADAVGISNILERIEGGFARQLRRTAQQQQCAVDRSKLFARDHFKAIAGQFGQIIRRKIERDEFTPAIAETLAINVDPVALVKLGAGSLAFAAEILPLARIIIQITIVIIIVIVIVIVVVVVAITIAIVARTGVVAGVIVISAASCPIIVIAVVAACVIVATRVFAAACVIPAQIVNTVRFVRTGIGVSSIPWIGLIGIFDSVRVIPGVIVSIVAVIRVLRGERGQQQAGCRGNPGGKCQQARKSDPQTHRRSPWPQPYRKAANKHFFTKALTNLPVLLFLRPVYGRNISTG